MISAPRNPFNRVTLRKKKQTLKRDKNGKGNRRITTHFPLIGRHGRKGEKEREGGISNGKPRPERGKVKKKKKTGQ